MNTIEPGGLPAPLAEAYGAVIEMAEPEAQAALALRLEAARPGARGQGARVVVAGDFKSGKSALVNALVGEYACPALPDAATVLPTVVRYGEASRATLLLRGDPPTAREIAVPGIVQYVCEVPDAPEDAGDVQACDVAIPSPLLESGLLLVDMPGAGALDTRFGRLVQAELSAADGALFVTDASQELTEPELTLLRAALDVTSRVAVAYTKIDLYPHWRRLLDINRGHLAAAGLDVPIFPVSARLAELAGSLDVPELADESGVAALRDHLAAVAGAREADGHAELAEALTSELADMEAVTRKALEALDPARAEQAIHELETSFRHVQQLGSGNARWRLALEDDIKDLDLEVRAMLERLEAEAYMEVSDRIEEIDPGKAPEQLAAWMTERSESMVAEVLRFIGDRSLDIRDAVAAQIATLDADLIDSGAHELARTGMINVLRHRSAVGERGGLGALNRVWGVGEPLMALAGLAPGLANPVTLVVAAPASVFLVVRSVMKYRSRQLTARREAAREDFLLGLDRVKDIVLHEAAAYTHQIERRLRDAVIDAARERENVLYEAIAEARRARTADAGAREERRGALAARLERIEALTRQLAAVPPGASHG